MVVVPLTSGFCPLLGEVGPGTCASFLVGGTVAFPLVVIVGFILLVGRVMSRDVFKGVCELRTTL